MKKIILTLFISLISTIVHGGNSLKYCDFDIKRNLLAISNFGASVEETPEDLKLIREFQQLRVCAPIRHEEYFDLLGKTNDKQKLILSYALQDLSGENYIRFIERVIKIFEEKKMPREILKISAFPGVEWNTYFTENYQEKRVKKVLKCLKEYLANETSFIDKILSGKRLESLTAARFESKAPVHSYIHLFTN